MMLSVLPPANDQTHLPDLQRNRLEALRQDGDIERVTRCDCWRDDISRRLIAATRAFRAAITTAP